MTMVNDPKKKNMSERQIHKILEEFNLSEGTSMQDSMSQISKQEVKTNNPLNLDATKKDKKPKALNMLDQIGEEIKEEEENNSHGSVSEDDNDDQIGGGSDFGDLECPKTINRHHNHNYAKKHGSSKSITAALQNLTTDENTNTEGDEKSNQSKKNVDVDMENL
eukprot:CAMPEP_0168612514 /NCGR_PEP_ID=MMETSP0449_2-20121227/2958_1 /TAXON_ID=1082188 /ORGANISM="Strombidium rassoulzadegani, Strain ras09" /LENGTH=163 /DNA_ID=CAMNT_0008653085 /DNA_START=37 /DNA_END=528 /DNA_ORIENTATION=+